MNKNKKFGTENFLKIGGKRVDLFSAKIVYRCAVCLAKLDYRNSGLICSKDKSHRGFIHRNQGGHQTDQISTKLSEIEDKIWKAQ